MAYSDEVTADSPLAWWKLDETAGASSAADSSGNGHNGTATSVTFGVSSPALPAGLPGTCASFDGSASRVDSAWNGPPSSSAFTLEAWANENSQAQTANYPVFVSAENTGNTLGCTLHLDFGSSEIAACNGTAQTVKTDGAFPASGWVYLAGTWDGSNLHIYVNGTEQAPAVALAAYSAAAAGLSIGAFPGGGAYFKGLLAEVAVYGSALSLTRIQAHYNAGTTAAGPSPGTETAAAAEPSPAVTVTGGRRWV